ncbi:MAG TPA: hypothetical protein VKQ30_20730 [Ktedonobacterales bacterium]|nr:hypothetical protein [Ktedonobacterales bacterium]
MSAMITINYNDDTESEVTVRVTLVTLNEVLEKLFAKPEVTSVVVSLSRGGRP